MEIRASIKQPGMFCLIWNDSGVEVGAHFTRIETVNGKPSQDVVLMNGLKRVETLHVSADAVHDFFGHATSVGVPVFAEMATGSNEVAA